MFIRASLTALCANGAWDTASDEQIPDHPWPRFCIGMERCTQPGLGVAMR